jgi:hypothetical protein
MRNDFPNEEGEAPAPEDCNIIYGSYINKDSSNKPQGVFKMLKVNISCFIL